MFKFVSRLWHRLFLEERPSMSLGVFRMCVAFTTWAHVFPSLVHLKDTYFPGTFKTHNSNFFPVEVIGFVDKSPEWVIVFFMYLFCVTSFTMFIGLFSQLSCILMTVSCYYFYALNSYHVGTLSWDILIVVLFLMCLTPYPGDYFSMDVLRKKDLYGYRRKRPFFLQRIFQMQIAFIFFYTALYKSTGQGNWITDNPLYYVLNYPPAGVTKTFLWRDFFVDKPQLCYWLGITVVIVEYLMLFLLFNRRTRITAIYLGSIFCLLLILTLDVPATFFFLFPTQLLLFINPKKILAWVEHKRKINQDRPFGTVLYDGTCGFCVACFKALKIMDLMQTIDFVDFHEVSNLKNYHPELNPERVKKQMFLITSAGQIYGGFYAIRRISVWLPMMWPFLLIFYLPLAGFLGSFFYRFVARNRFILSLFFSCQRKCSV